MNLAELAEEFGGKEVEREGCDPCLLHPMQGPLNLTQSRRESGLSALPVVRFPRDVPKDDWRLVLVVDDETGKAEYKKMFGDGHMEDLA